VNVCVLGLWHLGTVTAACLASAGHDVTGIDFDSPIVAKLSAGEAPLFEPGLDDLLKSGLASGRLRFSADAAAVAGADVVWIAYDTPVDEDDHGDVEYVTHRVSRLFPHLSQDALVVVSSQLPVGTTSGMASAFAASDRASRRVRFAYSPENLRLGKAIDSFTHPDRIVVGVREEDGRGRLAELLRSFSTQIEWMSVESAEMSKHALNAFLATSVTFINEIAALCERVGADATDVERALKSERRIGPLAYLSPGGAIAGGTLARDIVFLSALGRTHGVTTHLLSSVKASNDVHRHWAQQRLQASLKSIAGTTVGVWGLTYKPGTDTLRRSGAVELCQWLQAQGATVRAHDPAVKELPAGLSSWLHLSDTPLGAVEGASALIVATPWPEYRDETVANVGPRMKRRLVIDANRFLAKTFGSAPDVEYVSVGKAS
jgi:UDPglucose 6-dehydrogenase